MSPADVAAIAGTFIAAIITGLGLRRGEAEKHGMPAPDPGLAAGVFLGMDAETLRSILDELRETHADLTAWRKEDDIERRAVAARSAVERFEQIETNQATILELLRKIDEEEGS